jgi:hypothetical protein
MRLMYRARDRGGYTIQDKQSGVAGVQASHVDIYGEDVPA